MFCLDLLTRNLRSNEVMPWLLPKSPNETIAKGFGWYLSVPYHCDPKYNTEQSVQTT